MLISCSNYAENIHEEPINLNRLITLGIYFTNWKVDIRLPYVWQYPVYVRSEHWLNPFPDVWWRTQLIASLLNDSTYCSTLGYNQYTIPALFIPYHIRSVLTMSAEDFIKRMKKNTTGSGTRERMEKAKVSALLPKKWQLWLLSSKKKQLIQGRKANGSRSLYQPPAHRYALHTTPL